MLTSTFCHIPGIGPRTERGLWTAGIRGWDAFRTAASPPLSAAKTRLVAGHLDESAEHLENEDPNYFCERLATNQHWRLFSEFRRRTAYLDIETTGLGGPGDYVTTIALYDGRSVSTYVKGHNLEDFAEDVLNYRLIVTYNGKAFDVPFIRNFMGLRLTHAHIDLMHVLRSLGYRGGLKGCERQLGLDRGDLEGIDGYFAVLLWQDFLRHRNDAALETLLAYNVQDVVNLETLMVLAYNMKLKETPFSKTHAIATPGAPKLPFKPDMETVSRIRREHHFF